MAVAILRLIFEGEQVRGGQGDTVDSEKVIYPEVVEFATFNLQLSIVRDPVVHNCFSLFNNSWRQAEIWILAQVKSDPR